MDVLCLVFLWFSIISEMHCFYPKVRLSTTILLGAVPIGSFTASGCKYVECGFNCSLLSLFLGL